MKTYILLIVLLLVSWACTEDLGTYEYLEINEIEIDTIKNQTVMIYDTLRIKPDIKQSHTSSEENLEYVWYCYKGATAGDNSAIFGKDIYPEADTLSTSRNLEYRMIKSIGKHDFYFKATDKTTGVSGRYKFTVEVTGQFTKGLMVLGETDGITNLSFINNTGHVFELYTTENGMEIGQNPRFIANATASKDYLQEIYVLCENGGAVLNNSDFSKKSDFKDVFWVAPPSVKPESYYQGWGMFGLSINHDVIINAGKLYTRIIGSTKDSVAFRPAIAGDYYLSPYAVVNTGTSLFYDNQNQRFLLVKSDFSSLQNKFSEVNCASGGAFDPNDVGMEMIYFAPGYTGKNGYAICRDRNAKLWCLTFSIYTLSRSPMTAVSKREIHNAPGIGQSKGYAMSIAKPFLFYADGSKVVRYDLETDVHEMIYDVDTVISNSRVDQIYMELRPSSNDYYGIANTSKTYNTVLYVASSEENKKEKTGTVHILKLNDNGTLDQRQELHKNVCGRIVSMHYKR